MSNAHAFAARSIGTYRFLCELQSQGNVSGLMWSWGVLGSVPFLPRVTSGRLVLSRACWNLERQELAALAAARDGALFEVLDELRARRKLPRRVALKDADNELPLDFENALSIETFPEELCAKGPEGRFVHEIVVPFVNTPAEAPKQRARTARSAVASRRTHPPGSRWLYAKIYTGTATADRILVEVVAPIVERVMESEGLERWFFIRYGDPDWHLRLRFCGDPERLHSSVLPALEERIAPLLEQGLAWKLALDTYEREVERYGGPRGAELSEGIFHADSDAVLEIAGLLEGAEGADARWRLALRGMHMLLDDLGLDLDARLAVVDRARRGLAVEFGMNVASTRTLGAKYRAQSKALETLLDPARDAGSPFGPGIAALSRRSEKIAPVAEALRAAEKAGQLWLPVGDLAQSYLHMHANRLLRAEARRQELVLYDFLARIYESRIARARKRH